jgi:hypothetical protein
MWILAINSVVTSPYRFLHQLYPLLYQHTVEVCLVVCLPLFPDHVVRSKTADFKYFPFCLGRPPFLDLAPSRANSLQRWARLSPNFLFYCLLPNFVTCSSKYFFRCRFSQLKYFFVLSTGRLTLNFFLYALPTFADFRAKLNVNKHWPRPAMNRRFDPVRHRARAQCGTIRGESLFRSGNSFSNWLSGPRSADQLCGG